MKQTIQRHTRLVRFLALLVVGVILAGCETTIDPNATPVVMFPTAIPRVDQGNLPTFSVGTQGPIIVTATFPPNVVIATQPPVVTGPTKVPTLDANWIAIADGIVYRRLAFYNSAGQATGILVTRIDPARASFRVKFVNGQTKNVTDWVNANPGVKVVVNGGYFTPQNIPIGLIAVEGTLMNRATGRNDAGFFQVKGGQPKVRSLFLEPYNNTERFDQLVEGFPILMVRGRAAPAFNPDLSTAQSRRTIVAQDVYGRILFMVTSPGMATLLDMAKYLAVSGLEIDTALNLDGGGSTQMYIATNGPSQLTPGLNPVPVAITVFSR
jgi:uncharacterized protein YigE (DUF2233 family)